jgi:hypothetical protein
MGDIVCPSSATGHRVYFDGRVIGEGAKTYRVPCGAHVVKIGSAGVPRPILVPCGGTMTVAGR